MVEQLTLIHNYIYYMRLYNDTSKYHFIKKKRLKKSIEKYYLQILNEDIYVLLDALINYINKNTTFYTNLACITFNYGNIIFAMNDTEEYKLLSILYRSKFHEFTINYSKFTFIVSNKIKLSRANALLWESMDYKIRICILDILKQLL